MAIEELFILILFFISLKFRIVRLQTAHEASNPVAVLDLCYLIIRIGVAFKNWEGNSNLIFYAGFLIILEIVHITFHDHACFLAVALEMKDILVFNFMCKELMYQQALQVHYTIHSLSRWQYLNISYYLTCFFVSGLVYIWLQAYNLTDIYIYHMMIICIFMLQKNLGTPTTGVGPNTNAMFFLVQKDSLKGLHLISISPQSKDLIAQRLCLSFTTFILFFQKCL
ncbi:hypothetical protein ACJX0J_001678, partial [Zea mays]